MRPLIDDPRPVAVVVLGGRIRWRRDGANARERVLVGPCERRARAATAVHRVLADNRRGDTFVVASGGRYWGSAAEACVIRDRLVASGVPGNVVLLELASLSTEENARRTAPILRARGIEQVVVVTCTFHLPRALRLFRRVGLAPFGVAAPPPDDPSVIVGAAHAIRERLAPLFELRR